MVFYHRRRDIEVWWSEVFDHPPESLAHDWMVFRIAASPRLRQLAPLARSRWMKVPFAKICRLRAGLVISTIKPPRPCIGFSVSRAVIVQASCHGADNRATLDAIGASDGRYRGVAIVDERFDHRAFRTRFDGGIRGVRFNFVQHFGGWPDPPLLERTRRA